MEAAGETESGSEQETTTTTTGKRRVKKENEEDGAEAGAGARDEGKRQQNLIDKIVNLAYRSFSRLSSLATLDCQLSGELTKDAHASVGRRARLQVSAPVSISISQGSAPDHAALDRPKEQTNE